MKDTLRTILAVAVAAAAMASQGLTMDDLRSAPNLTPEKFAKQFRNFDYEYHKEVQDPGDFLAREAGDCDDYAILASMIFAEKGYHPRLVSVRMGNMSHVVVFFPETQTYLDYNNRSYFRKTAKSDGSLRDLANRVARTFGRDWTSVTEFTYGDGLKEVVARETRENPRRPGEAGVYLAAQ
jgi:hypothetical protein